MSDEYQFFKPDHILEVRLPAGGGEVLRIAADGRIFWRGREIETDDEFRKAMLDLKDALANMWKLNRGG